MRFKPYISFFIGLAIALIISSCESVIVQQQKPDSPEPHASYPDFITSKDNYFDTKIADVPIINATSYQLKISGAVDHPATFSLQELYGLSMYKKTLTIECIGNPANGSQIGTAEWRGFRVYDLLDGLGIKEEASTVKYISADGYFTYNTLDELKNSEVLGALYMNDEAIPPLYGFPLRMIFPGYYGVRQPGWIVEIQVLESGPEDFWSGSGWKSDSSMSIDSKIFFPKNKSDFAMGDSIIIGGTAFGARRISRIEITLDNGTTWITANIRQSLDQDYVWVFWEVSLPPQNSGTLTIRSRATALNGSVQPETDSKHLDGSNAWPTVSINVLE